MLSEKASDWMIERIWASSLFCVGTEPARQAAVGQSHTSGLCKVIHATAHGKSLCNRRLRLHLSIPDISFGAKDGNRRGRYSSSGSY